MSKTAKLRVGIVGVGHIGRFHTRHLSQHEDWTCTGLVDSDAARAAQIAAEFGVPVREDFKTLLKEVDAVFITSPTPSHFSLAQQALERDRHVFIEKPITTRIEEAEILVELADRRGLKLQVGHIERFNPALVALDQIVLQPRFIEAHRLMPFAPRGLNNPVVHENMIHDIDIILSLVKSPVTEIRASGVAVISRHADMANARLTFQNGCVANVTASRVSLGLLRKMRIFQSETYITIDFQKGSTELYQLTDGVIPDDVEQAFPLEGTSKQILYRRMHLDKQDAMYAEQAAFARAIRNDSVPVVSGADGLEALRIADRINQALQLDTRE